MIDLALLSTTTLEAQYFNINEFRSEGMNITMEYRAPHYNLVTGIRQQLGKKNLPVLMITSKSEITTLLDAVKAGISNYIIKPWEEEDFAKKLVECDKN